MTPSFEIGPRGVLCAWQGPLGPCIARFEAWTREQPVFARAVGNAGAEIGHRPCVWAAPSAIVVLYCETTGALMQALGDDGKPLWPPQPLANAAYAIAVVPLGEQATVFCADPEGVLEIEIDANGPLGGPVRRVAEERGGAMLSAARVHGAPLLAIAHRGADSFGLLTPGERLVRHSLGAPCDDLDLQSNGTRALLAVQLARGRVQVALLGRGGRVIERAHDVLTVDDGPGESPRPLWQEDHWTLLVRGSDGSILHRPMGERGHPFRLPRSQGAFAVDHQASFVYTLEVEPRDDEAAVLSMWRCARDGSDPQQRRIEVQAVNASERRIVRSTRRALEVLGDRLHGAGTYRVVGRPPVLSAEGCAIAWDDERGPVSLRAVPRGEGIALTVRSHLGESADTEAASSLVRLAQFVRERISPAARARRAADRAWAQALADAIGACVEAIDTVGSSLRLELSLGALPPPDRLESWLRKLRDAHAARV